MFVGFKIVHSHLSTRLRLLRDSHNCIGMMRGFCWYVLLRCVSGLVCSVILRRIILVVDCCALLVWLALCCEFAPCSEFACVFASGFIDCSAADIPAFSALLQALKLRAVFNSLCRHFFHPRLTILHVSGQCRFAYSLYRSVSPFCFCTGNRTSRYWDPFSTLVLSGVAVFSLGWYPCSWVPGPALKVRGFDSSFSSFPVYLFLFCACFCILP